MAAATIDDEEEEIKKLSVLENDGQDFDWNRAILLIDLLCTADSREVPGGEQLCANDIQLLVEFIVNREKEIFSQEEKTYESFFSYFVALSTHIICSRCSILNRKNLDLFVEASKVIIRFCLVKLKEKDYSSLSPRILIQLIESYCKGESFLVKQDIIEFVAVIKSFAPPSSTKSSKLYSTKIIIPTDPLDKLIDTIYQIGNCSNTLSTVLETKEKSIVSNIPIKKVFLSKNLTILQELGGTDLLLNACLNFPYLQHYIGLYKSSLNDNKIVLPSSFTDALEVCKSFQSLLEELNSVLKVVSFPIFEPFSKIQLEILTTLAMSCNLLCINIAACDTILMNEIHETGKKDYTQDRNYSFLVEKCINIFNLILTKLKKSSRIQTNGLQVLYNFYFIAAWCLLTSTKELFPINKIEDVLKDFQPGTYTLITTKGTGFEEFSVVSVILAKLGLNFLATLLENFHLEKLQKELGSSENMMFEIFGKLTFSETLNKLLIGLDLTDILFKLLYINHKKILSIAQSNQEQSFLNRKPPDDIIPTENDDRLHIYEDYSNDEENEPILGKWFEETISSNSPNQNISTPFVQSKDNLPKDKPVMNLNPVEPFSIPDKINPITYFGLNSSIVKFAMDYLITNTEGLHIYSFRNSLQKNHIVILTEIMKDIDNEIFNKSDNIGFFENFYSLFFEFNHKLLSSMVLSNYLKDTLLYLLGIDSSTDHLQIMNISTGCLSLIANILLRKQKEDKINGVDNKLCVDLWHKVILSLKLAIIEENELKDFDLNIEFAQILMFIFHNFSHETKRAIILNCAESIKVSSHHKSCKNLPLQQTRLLVIFEYLLHYYSIPMASLYEQVQWNIFNVIPINKASKNSDGLMGKLFYHFKHIEENFSSDNSSKIIFYSLIMTSEENAYSLSLKPDTNALKILMNEGFSYNEFYESLILLLDTCASFDEEVLMKERNISHHSACTMQYFFALTWRILRNLPCSLEFLKLLDRKVFSPSTILSNAQMLIVLHLNLKITDIHYFDWIKECLIFQGVDNEASSSLLSSISVHLKTIKFYIQLVQDTTHILMLGSHEGLNPQKKFPSLISLSILDILIAKLKLLFEESFTKSDETEVPSIMEIANSFLPSVLLLIQMVNVISKSCLIYQLVGLTDSKINETSPNNLSSLFTVLGMGSNQVINLSGLNILKHLPPIINDAVSSWNSYSYKEFPSFSAWQNNFSSDQTTSESYIDAILKGHLKSLSDQKSFTLMPSNKHVLLTLVRFCSDLSIWLTDNINKDELYDILFPLLLDAANESINDNCVMILERIIGPVEGTEFLSKLYYYLFHGINNLVINYSSSQSFFNVDILLDCLKMMDSHIDKETPKLSLTQFYSKTGDLTQILLSTSKDGLPSDYVLKIFKFFNKIFHLAEDNENMQLLCLSLTNLKDINSSDLQNWFKKVMKEPEESCHQEIRNFLLSFANLLVKKECHIISHTVQSLISALIPTGSDLILDKNDKGFSELMKVITTLSQTISGTGQLELFSTVVMWLQSCKNCVFSILPDQTKEFIKESDVPTMMNSAYHILQYLKYIIGALRNSFNSVHSTFPFTDYIETFQETDNEWGDDLAFEEDSIAEDSDEESQLSKLCTFTVTQKEFMNQHWYHCHTCKMIDVVGVCTVCAKVCHKDHDLSYAKYGSFFCDCGAKEDGSCKALTKRPSTSGIDPLTEKKDLIQSPFSMEKKHKAPQLPTTSINEHPTSSGSHNLDILDDTTKNIRKQVEGCKEMLSDLVKSSCVLDIVLSFFEIIVENLLTANLANEKTLSHASKALNELHVLHKKIEYTDQLMVPTLGSQEGAFENVRLNYAGDQGQTIRQLISAQMLKRVAMCCLSSPHGRQHLAISHDKGKITFLQLSTLLNQADSNKKKLTLTRLASANVPFTVLNICGNQCNEELLAVSGLKDLHVLTLSSGGSITDHLALQIGLEAGNFIIKPIWLPGSQKELAIITADFVKIYDLSSNLSSPQYYFLLPSGKIRDVTFIFNDDKKIICFMSSAGYIYSQSMEKSSSAKHGPFFVTNIIELKHKDLLEKNGQIAGGGVSIYFSHCLQLLFMSFSQGLSFCSATSSFLLNKIDEFFPIALKSSASANKSLGVPFSQWSEITNHPGLIYCLTQNSNNPVILMIKPESIMIQEITNLPSKTKVQDVVSIRHSSFTSEVHKTTMILLSEDGSLRIYMANTKFSDFWLNSNFYPKTPIFIKQVKKKKILKSGHSANQIIFPIDFFEHCQVLNDIEYGGKDLLETYNAQQIKHRLNTTGTYIASNKTNGFQIEIVNNNNSMVMVGLRIHVGSQSVERAPSFIELFGRQIPVNLTHNRWYDIPFTREECISSDRKLAFFVGASLDPTGITMVDSINVYCKTKENFGWPDDTSEEFASSTPTNLSANATLDVDSSYSSNIKDKLILLTLELMEDCFCMIPSIQDSIRLSAVNTVTSLLTNCTPNIQHQLKLLLAVLITNRNEYHAHKDKALLKSVVKCLSYDYFPTGLDMESYHNLIVTSRSIALLRPQNLVNLTETLEIPLQIEGFPFLEKIIQGFWYLHSKKPKNSSLAPVCQTGFTHIEATVHALIEICHAFSITELNTFDTVIGAYFNFLISEDCSVSFPCKQALFKIYKTQKPNSHEALQNSQVAIKTSENNGNYLTNQDQQQLLSEENLHQDEGAASQFDIMENVQPMVVEPSEIENTDDHNAPNSSPFEALMGGAEGFAQVLDIDQDADDDRMMELAIALSLQDQQLDSASDISGIPAQDLLSLETGILSDTNTSVVASDDEESTTAMDESILPVSNTEQVGNIQTESSGTTLSIPQPVIAGSQVEVNKKLTQETGTVYSVHHCNKLLLSKFIEYLPKISSVGGIRSIPFMQVLLMLSSELEVKDNDYTVLDNLLQVLINELKMTERKTDELSNRQPQNEVFLIIMRLLSVFMSRAKPSNDPNSEVSSYISTNTASLLLKHGTINYCLLILKSLWNYWKNNQLEKEEMSSTSYFLKPRPITSPPDMSPFFLRQYVKGHSNDVFKAYPQLLTEMVLRIPYQIKKIIDATGDTPIQFDQDWYYYLCEYMMIQETPFVRRQVRKLLLFLCGSKEKYRQLRDLHTLESHMILFKSICQKYDLDKTGNNLNIPYDVLITLVEHLKACTDIATSRTNNWQLYCQKDKTILSFLFEVTYQLDEGLAPTLLQLLTSALCGSKIDVHLLAKDNKDITPKQDYSSSLISQLNSTVKDETLAKFIHCFLLECNSSSVRWQAHSLLIYIYRISPLNNKKLLLDLMWTIWSGQKIAQFGQRAAQFVDLLGYITLKFNSTEEMLKEFSEKAIAVFYKQNKILLNHPNSNIYNMLLGLVEFDGYYLESEPCLICNNPEIPFQNIKLSSIKVDSKYTANTQIIKLIGTYMISKISLRIGDLKRTKMVKTINIYYTNRTVQSIVELKNRPLLWRKAKTYQLTAGQIELKAEFILPIVSANLMIEYVDFYENIQSSSESLQCPRCSMTVPSNPGVCGNCGENVFQCHKCRSINYDEKDPFLCNACGFCKYGKFDYSLTAKPCCTVDPIENEENRKKATTAINSLLEKADNIYRQLIAQKPLLEALITHVKETRGKRSSFSKDDSNKNTNTSHVNKVILQISQKYCGDCKASFEELSKIIQKVLSYRKNLLEYDMNYKRLVSGNSIPMKSAVTISKSYNYSSEFRRRIGYCYGCTSATIEHCITLMRALSTHSDIREMLINKNLIEELVINNMNHGTVTARLDIKQLLCQLTNGSTNGTEHLNDILSLRISIVLNNFKLNPDMADALYSEMSLLSSTMKLDDNCWESRLKNVMKIFLIASKIENPMVTENIILPSLKIIQTLIKPNLPESKKSKDSSIMKISSINPIETDLYTNINSWISCDTEFKQWKDALLTTKFKGDEKSLNSYEEYLKRKYFFYWRLITTKIPQKLQLESKNWLRYTIFCSSSSTVRQIICSLLEELCQNQNRYQHVLDLLSCYLVKVGSSGECAAEYLALYQRLIKPPKWKIYLAKKGILIHIGHLITKEISLLTILEENCLNSDLSQGYAVKVLTEMLAVFMDLEVIKQMFKGKLVGIVLNGYLSLRKLVIQRTKLIDDSEDMLLELLEIMTTGTESETKAFMAICVETLQKYSLDDYRTPVFIFERICNIIYPEENDVGEFFMILEKDSQQEDFLQGRMQGNPYSSNDPGLGPLMKDVKNKICQDCELVALLEDDNGMELLVKNKIISLDLPVREVYKKIWCLEKDAEPMKIIYRMRGLLGDATEDIIDCLDKKDENFESEEVYNLAVVMSQCKGLDAMLFRLAGINNLYHGKELLAVLLKLFSYCVKIKKNRTYLTQPFLKTISIMVNTLNMILLTSDTNADGNLSNMALAEQLMNIMELILEEAYSKPISHENFLQLFENKSQFEMLLERIKSSFVCNHVSVMQKLVNILPYLSFGEEAKMKILIDYFKPYLKFIRFDEHHEENEELYLKCFCSVTIAIQVSENGNKLKDLILEAGIVQRAVNYIKNFAPKASLGLDSSPWRHFVSRPSLPYILRLLTGLCQGHAKTQLLVARDCVPAIHRLEQISSEEGVGSIAESLMEAMKHHPEVTKKIEEVRALTRSEKKRLAMAMRQKQLGALGMFTNEKGQVTATKISALKHDVEELTEETGLTCCICREGYKYQPSKVLGIYTYTKRISIEEFESKARKTQGYTTVSHFNIVHYDCHLAAVRHARGREEWESAALQNSNTKCNGLLPIWGPKVPESAFVNCLARHNSYLQECTGYREPTYQMTLHDLKLLLLKFSHEKSLSAESGGGSRQSNICLIPYLLHTALYVINSTRALPREEKNLMNFLTSEKDTWTENSYEIDGAYYFSILALLILDYEKWIIHRYTFFEKLVFTQHTRTISPIRVKRIYDKDIKEYSKYKPALIFFGMIDKIYQEMFKIIRIKEKNQSWAVTLADYIRNNDESVLKSGEKVLTYYEENLIPTKSFKDFWEVSNMFKKTQEPVKYIQDIINF